MAMWLQCGVCMSSHLDRMFSALVACGAWYRPLFGTAFVKLLPDIELSRRYSSVQLLSVDSLTARRKGLRLSHPCCLVSEGL